MKIFKKGNNWLIESSNNENGARVVVVRPHTRHRSIIKSPGLRIAIFSEERLNRLSSISAER